MDKGKLNVLRFCAEVFCGRPFMKSIFSATVFRAVKTRRIYKRHKIESFIYTSVAFTQFEFLFDRHPFIHAMQMKIQFVHKIFVSSYIASFRRVL